MKKSLFLAVKDLNVLGADKFGLFWILCFPVLYALFFGAVFSGASKGPSGMKVAVVDEDQSEFSRLYVSRLQSYEALELTRMSRQEAVNDVRTGKQVAAVVLKKGFGRGFGGIFDSNDPKLEIAADPSRRMESGYLQGLLAQAQFEALSKRLMDREWIRNQVGTLRSGIEKARSLAPKQVDVFLDFFDAFDAFMQNVDEKNYKAGLEGGILNVANVQVERERQGPMSGFQITFPQAIMWGLLGCAATFAISIVTERKTGTFQRLLIAPLSRGHILGGKALACLLTCIVVICILCICAKIIFRMPINNAALFVPAVICAAFCFVGLMMFASTLGRTEQAVAGLAWAMFLIMAMLGGGMVPLFVMPPWLRTLSHISPVRWGIFALEGAVWRDFTPAEMMKPCLVLLAIGLAFFSLGVLKLRRVEL